MYQDAQGVLYVHEESTSPAEPEKTTVWPWVVAGAVVVAGTALWMSQSPTRSENPVKPKKPSRLLLEAANPDTPWKRLEALAKHKDPEVRRAVLQNPALCPVDDQGNVDIDLLYHLAGEFPDETAEAPAFVLHAFYGDPTPMLRVIQRIVYRTKDPERVRSTLSLFGQLDPLIRNSAANNQMTPPEILRELAEEWPEEVAKNSNAPPDLLRELVEEWPGWVALNPNAPHDVLRELAKEWPQTVAYNPNTHPDVLRNLLQHQDGWVREEAKKNLSRRGLL